MAPGAFFLGVCVFSHSFFLLSFFSFLWVFGKSRNLDRIEKKRKKGERKKKKKKKKNHYSGGLFFNIMSIFEALGVRKRMELCCEVAEKLGAKYMRPTGEGVQCAACGMFVVGPELKFARIAPFFSPRRRPPFFSSLGVPPPKFAWRAGT